MGDSWREEVHARQKRLTLVARFTANRPQSRFPDSAESYREPVQYAFFPKKKKFPTKAQLRAQGRLF